MLRIFKLANIQWIARGSASADALFDVVRGSNGARANVRSISDVQGILNEMVQQRGVSSKQIEAIEFCKKYCNMSYKEKHEVLKYIADNYDFYCEQAKAAAASFLREASSSEQCMKSSERLKSALYPRYGNIFNAVARLDGGMKHLLDLQADVQELLKEQFLQDKDFHSLKAMSEHLRNLLAFAFSVGFLNLERVTWDSSCRVLQKVSEYEAVHPVRNWLDMKKRVGPYRRCYVYTHSSMPNEPLVILHTALTKEISSSIHEIVSQNITASSDGAPDQEQAYYEDPAKIESAIFYSITSTQKGLRGIELGNYLIKRVVGEVLKEFPHISKLSSLSPVPGFRKWLLLELQKAQEGSSRPLAFAVPEQKKLSIVQAANIDSTSDFWSSLQHIISSNRWSTKPELVRQLEDPLLRLCAYYLVHVKRRSYALNSVAHFHLRNGAVLWRLNWKADVSPRGLDNSCGIMVNYRYYVDETERNSQEYLQTYDIKISESVRTLLDVLNVC